MDDTIPYQGYTIRVLTLRTTKGWTAEGRIIRLVDGAREEVPFSLEAQVFPTEEKARDYAFAVGKQWVDKLG